MRPRSKPNRILVAFKTIQLFAFYLIPFWLLSHSKKKKNIPNIVIEVCCMDGLGVSLSFLLQAKCQHGSIVTDKCMKYRFKVGLFLFFLSRHKPIRRKQVAITNLLLCVCVCRIYVVFPVISCVYGKWYRLIIDRISYEMYRM